MASTMPFYNLMSLALILFSVATFFYGLFGRKGALAVMRGDIKAQESAGPLLMGLGIAGLVVWGTFDLMRGMDGSLIIQLISGLASSVLNQSMSPWQPVPTPTQ